MLFSSNWSQRTPSTTSLNSYLCPKILLWSGPKWLLFILVLFHLWFYCYHFQTSRWAGLLAKILFALFYWFYLFSVLQHWFQDFHCLELILSISIKEITITEKRGKSLCLKTIFQVKNNYGEWRRFSCEWTHKIHWLRAKPDFAPYFTVIKGENYAMLLGIVPHKSSFVILILFLKIPAQNLRSLIIWTNSIHIKIPHNDTPKLQKSIEIETVKADEWQYRI